MKKLNILTFLIVFCTLLPFTFGNLVWYQEAGADIKAQGSGGFTAYGSNNNSRITVFDYAECSISGSLYNPIAGDINYDTSPDIYTVPSKKKIEVYTQDCAFLAEIDTVDNITAMPTLLNYGGTSIQNVVILTSNDLLIYGWSTGIPVPVELLNITYRASTTNLNLLTCTRSDVKMCYGFKSGEDDVYVFNLTSGTVTKKTAILQQNVKAYVGRTGISSTRGYSYDGYFISMCYMIQAVGGSTAYCDILDINGDVTYDFDYVVSGQAVTTIKWMGAYVAKVSNLYRVITYGSANSASGFRWIGMFDVAGNVNRLGIYTGTTAWLSSPAVADYNKDGLNEMCYINKSASNVQFLRCYNAIGTLVNSSNLSGYTFGSGLILADFNSSEPTLGIGTEEGIFYTNYSGGRARVWFNASTPTASDDGSFLMTVQSSTTAPAPSWIHSDTSATTIIRNVGVSGTCGDGTCQDWENAFTCNADCGAGLDFCITNADCPSNYPLCVPGTGECVSIYPYDPNATLNCETAADCPATSPLCIAGICGRESCTKSSDCPYQRPYCYVGVCISGASSGITNIQLTGDDAPNVTAAKTSADEFAGYITALTSSNIMLRFIIAIAMIMFFVFTATKYTQNATIILFVGILATVLVTVIGILPMYVLIVLIISIIAIVLLGRMIFPSSGGG